MLTRIMSAVVALPILIAVVYFGGTPLFLGTLAISLIGLYEFYGAMKALERKPIFWCGYLGTMILLFQIKGIILPQVPYLVPVGMVIILSIIPMAKPQYTIEDSIVTLYGLCYVPLLLAHLIMIDQGSQPQALWLVFLIAWGSDTFAYFTGYFLGKRKLCPTISPKKTVEGAIGGALGAMIISGIFGYYFLNDHLLLVMAMGLLGSIISVLGDLTASIIKRTAGIKDYGNIMPGHGGILDRFDSILFTAPFVYYFMGLLAF